MDENVTAGNIIADWPFTVFYHIMGHRGVLRSTRATHMRSYAPILGMAVRSVCHSVDNLHEERCAPEMKYASLQAKCVVQGHIYIIWNDEGHGAQCRRQPRRGIQ